jgi:hypothetical protein
MTSTSQPRLRMNRQKRYDSFGECIYCGAKGARLTEEHIIPEAIGGQLIIDAASCDACCGETHAFEGHACDYYRPLRRQLNFPSRRRGKNDRERKKEEKFTLQLDNSRKIKVKSDEFPALLMNMTFPLPTILFTETPNDAPLTFGIYSIELMPDFGERLNEIKAKYQASSVSIVGIDKSSRADHGDLGRMLAKIAHSYAVAELGGPHSFRPFLTHIIRGQKPYYLTHFIGSDVVPAGEAADLHEIEIDQSGLGKERLIVVRLRLFATMKSQNHFIVVGERL